MALCDGNGRSVIFLANVPPLLNFLAATDMPLVQD
jgi:hypothetical protein